MPGWPTAATRTEGWAARMAAVWRGEGASTMLVTAGRTKAVAAREASDHRAQLSTTPTTARGGCGAALHALRTQRGVVPEGCVPEGCVEGWCLRGGVE
eukprot:3739036-Prymnesium_polylepis.1